MRNKASNLRPKKADSESLYELPQRFKEAGVHRILDQTRFDYGDTGGCCYATLIAAIEGIVKKDMSWEDMRDFYFDADDFYHGRSEKVGRAMKYLATVPRKFHSIGAIVKATDYTSIAPKDATYECLVQASQKFDCVGFALKGRSAFFSRMDGKIKKTVTLPPSAGHCMRLILVKRKGDANFDYWDLKTQNSWTDRWGADGFGILTAEDMKDIKIAEIKCCNFDIQPFKSKPVWEK